MPLDVPRVSLMCPFFSIALRWSSAAFADLKFSARAISDRVGGNPVFSTKLWMSLRISVCLCVSGFISITFKYKIL